MDCVRKTIEAEGPLALYKGLFATWVRIGPFALVFFVGLEHFTAVFQPLLGGAGGVA